MDHLFTIRGSARELGVHENTVRNWIDRNIIKKVVTLPSGVRRVPGTEIERLKVAMIEAPMSLSETGSARPAKFAGPDVILEEYPE